MGFDWENILDTSGAGLAEAYDDVVSTVIYEQEPSNEASSVPLHEV